MPVVGLQDAAIIGKKCGRFEFGVFLPQQKRPRKVPS
jgi:hypothetical protein